MNSLTTIVDLRINIFTNNFISYLTDICLWIYIEVYFTLWLIVTMSYISFIVY